MKKVGEFNLSVLGYVLSYFDFFIFNWRVVFGIYFRFIGVSVFVCVFEERIIVYSSSCSSKSSSSNRSSSCMSSNSSRSINYIFIK